MGAEYYYSVGYGFAGMPEQDAEGDELLAGWSFEAWQDGDVQRWLHEQGWDLLEADMGGNQWSGPWGRWSVVAKETIVRGGGRDDGPVLTRLDEVGEDAMDQLSKARWALKKDARIGWMLLVDVL